MSSDKRKHKKKQPVWAGQPRFEKLLADITSPSASKIKKASDFSLKHHKWYKMVVHLVEKQVKFGKTRKNSKLPQLFVMHHIMQEGDRKLKKANPYKERFGLKIDQTFRELAKGNKEDRPELTRVAKIWKERKYFPKKMKHITAVYEKFHISAKDRKNNKGRKKTPEKKKKANSLLTAITVLQKVERPEYDYGEDEFGQLGLDELTRKRRDEERKRRDEYEQSKMKNKKKRKRSPSPTRAITPEPERKRAKIDSGPEESRVPPHLSNFEPQIPKQIPLVSNEKIKRPDDSLPSSILQMPLKAADLEAILQKSNFEPQMPKQIPLLSTENEYADTFVPPPAPPQSSRTSSNLEQMLQEQARSVMDTSLTNNNNNNSSSSVPSSSQQQDRGSSSQQQQQQQQQSMSSHNNNNNGNNARSPINPSPKKVNGWIVHENQIDCPRGMVRVISTTVWLGFPNEVEAPPTTDELQGALDQIGKLAELNKRPSFAFAKYWNRRDAETLYECAVGKPLPGIRYVLKPGWARAPGMDKESFDFDSGTGYMPIELVNQHNVPFQQNQQSSSNNNIQPSGGHSNSSNNNLLPGVPKNQSSSRSHSSQQRQPPPRNMNHYNNHQQSSSSSHRRSRHSRDRSRSDIPMSYY